MTKKSIIVRENKKKKLENKYYLTYSILKNQIKKNKLSKSKKINQIKNKLKTLPRNSLAVRLRKRCLVTGRPRSYYRDFGQSRHFLYKKFNLCLLPGTKKSNW
uniref:ribosomal protein S14 n=1 Tax=Hydnora longicollis TaxID=1778543 RepID=UPI002114737D|nr:ribosomal protein S14 [Hydnora longicollis]USN93648.1 ribosomal protein S14 [Hydnora longicollis]